MMRVTQFVDSLKQQHASAPEAWFKQHATTHDMASHSSCVQLSHKRPFVKHALVDATQGTDVSLAASADASSFSILSTIRSSDGSDSAEFYCLTPCSWSDAGQPIQEAQVEPGGNANDTRSPGPQPATDDQTIQNADQDSTSQSQATPSDKAPQTTESAGNGPTSINLLKSSDRSRDDSSTMSTQTLAQNQTIWPDWTSEVLTDYWPYGLIGSLLLAAVFVLFRNRWRGRRRQYRSRRPPVDESIEVKGQFKKTERFRDRETSSPHSDNASTQAVPPVPAITHKTTSASPDTSNPIAKMDAFPDPSRSKQLLSRDEEMPDNLPVDDSDEFDLDFSDSDDQLTEALGAETLDVNVSNQVDPDDESSELRLSSDLDVEDAPTIHLDDDELDFDFEDVEEDLGLDDVTADNALDVTTPSQLGDVGNNASPSASLESSVSKTEPVGEPDLSLDIDFNGNDTVTPDLALDELGDAEAPVTMPNVDFGENDLDPTPDLDISHGQPSTHQPTVRVEDDDTFNEIDFDQYDELTIAANSIDLDSTQPDAAELDGAFARNKEPIVEDQVEQQANAIGQKAKELAAGTAALAAGATGTAGQGQSWFSRIFGFLWRKPAVQTTVAPDSQLTASATAASADATLADSPEAVSDSTAAVDPVHQQDVQTSGSPTEDQATHQSPLSAEPAFDELAAELSADQMKEAGDVVHETLDVNLDDSDSFSDKFDLESIAPESLFEGDEELLFDESDADLDLDVEIDGLDFDSDDVSVGIRSEPIAEAGQLIPDLEQLADAPSVETGIPSAEDQTDLQTQVDNQLQEQVVQDLVEAMQEREVSIPEALESVAAEQTDSLSLMESPIEVDNLVEPVEAIETPAAEAMPAAAEHSSAPEDYPAPPQDNQLAAAGFASPPLVQPHAVEVVDSANDGFVSQFATAATDDDVLTESMDVMLDANQQFHMAAMDTEDELDFAKDDLQAEQQFQRLTEQVESLQTSRDQLVEELTTAQALIAKLEDEQPSAAEQAQVATLQQQVEELKAQASQQRDELQTQLDSLASQLASAENHRAEGESILEKTRQELESSKSQLAEVQAELTAARDALNSAPNLAKTEGISTSSLMAAAAGGGGLGAVTQPTNATETDALDVADLKSRFEKRLKQEHRKRKAAQAFLEEAESQRNQVAAALREARKELLTIQEQTVAENFKLQHTSLQAELAAVTQERDQLKQDLEATRQAEQETRESLQNAIEEMSSTQQAKSTETDETLTALQEQVAELQSKLVAAESRSDLLERSQSADAAVAAEKKKTDKTLAQVNDRLAQLEAELHSTQQQLQAECAQVTALRAQLQSAPQSTSTATPLEKRPLDEPLHDREVTKESLLASIPRTPAKDSFAAGLFDSHEQTISPPSANPQPVSPGAGDDLTRIRGIGKVIAKKLNKLGVTQFAQIANWSAQDIKEIERKLKAAKRINRDQWVEQAKEFVAGS